MTNFFSKIKRQASSDISRVIMGLGNPGTKYENNRHNFGFMVIDHIAKARRLHFRSGGKSYLWCQDFVSLDGNNTAICLSKPLTYMNKSGMAARQLLEHFSLSPEKMLVVYDDIDLPLGRIRLRKNGSPGGHNGIKSITEYLQTQDFPRLRLGIGPQGDGVPAEDFVLEDFTRAEQKIVDKVLDISVEIVMGYLSSDFDSIMNKYNTIDLRETKTGDA